MCAHFKHDGVLLAVGGVFGGAVVLEAAGVDISNVGVMKESMTHYGAASGGVDRTRRYPDVFMITVGLIE